MATRKRANSQPEPRSCIICVEPESDEVTLVQPCRSCSMTYCGSCLVGMFQSATTDSTRMPPRCCNLIQIHTALGLDELSLTDEEATAYREKFEEWISPTKTYCPAPACSAFIPERKQSRTTEESDVPSLQSVLSGILEELTKSHEARFFRGGVDVNQFPNYKKFVMVPMDLTIIRKRLLASYYKTAADLTLDMRLIMYNAKAYNGEKHPVAREAKRFFDHYITEISNAMERLLALLPTQTVEKMFACPKCHIAICTSCKQVEHTGKPCDTSAKDLEMAMLEQYGYKRCPRCKAGVKKMFGCSHMQCVCGAHWCYYCLKSIELCDGSCEQRALEEDEDEYDSDEDGSQLSENEDEFAFLPPPPPAVRRTVPNQGSISDLRGPPAQQDGGGPSSRSAVLPTPAPRNITINGVLVQTTDVNQDPNFPINLDAGGPRRWADGDHDFGEEPEDEGFAQVWSCMHSFKTYEAPPADGVNRGDLDQMECNGCFIKVKPQKSESTSMSQKRRKVAQSQGSKNDPILIKDGPPSPAQGHKMAWECVRCKLVVCGGCKEMNKSDVLVV